MRTLPASVMTVVENDYITVRCYKDQGLIHHKLHQPITEAVLIESLDAALDAFREMKLTKWLSDDRENGPLPTSPSFLAWQTQWSLSAIQAGWKYWAMVVPTSVESAISLMDVFANLFEMGLEIKVFTDPEATFDWLASKP